MGGVNGMRSGATAVESCRGLGFARMQIGKCGRADTAEIGTMGKLEARRTLNLTLGAPR